jgi:hypothetical protein
MTTTKFLGLDCVTLENASLQLLITQSVGPRILALRFKDGENLFAELPGVTDALPDGGVYHLYGGHRLWHAPEDLPRSYQPDDEPVEISAIPGGLLVTQATETLTGMQKSLRVTLAGDDARVTVEHTLTNRGAWEVACAPWAITQLKPGGVAILPQPLQQSGLLPSRSLALWPYADMTSEHLHWGHDFIFLHAPMPKPFKMGFPNQRGWLAYWRAGVLFVKKASFDPLATYVDYGSSSECYCNPQFIELETLGPLAKIAPGRSVSHTETWEVVAVEGFLAQEAAAQALAERLALG